MYRYFIWLKSAQPQLQIKLGQVVSYMYNYNKRTYKRTLEFRSGSRRAIVVVEFNSNSPHAIFCVLEIKYKAK